MEKLCMMNADKKTENREAWTKVSRTLISGKICV